MGKRTIAVLFVGVLCVLLGGCASNGPQLPYPYGPPAWDPASQGVPATGALAPPNLPPTPTANVPANPAFPNLQRPNLGAPGTITQQREQATRFDPYGDNDAGPAIEGGRPRDFQRPYAQRRDQVPFAIALPRSSEYVIVGGRR